MSCSQSTQINECGCRLELAAITAAFQQCSGVVIAVGRQLAAKQAELEALGCEEAAAELPHLQADEKEKLRCELTLQARCDPDVHHNA